jgi:citrate lyase subunit beta / citryl-CoA lyase
LRSLLFVPGDSERKLANAVRHGADALILDLEDSVAAPNKEEARRSVLAFLQEIAGEPDRPLLYVRINGLDTELNEGDLDAVMAGLPDGIVLPKSKGGADVALLHARLSVREALHEIPDGATRILAIATESAAAIFGIGTYAQASDRLAGLAWGAEDLSADIGALSRREGQDWTEPFRLVRSLCLFGAAAARTAAIDTVYTDFRDLDGLRRECRAAVRDGFSGKLAIHPEQVPVINEAFTPTPEAIAEAERVTAAFAEGDGVATLDGRMLDRPHLDAAERLLARAGRRSP